MKIKNGPSVTYEMVFAIWPRRTYSLMSDGCYHPSKLAIGRLVRSTSMGAVMYHKHSELEHHFRDAAKMVSE